MIRRLDDRETVARIAAADESDARELLARVETEIRGSAAEFEAAWGIRSDVAADPGPDVRQMSPAGDIDAEPREGERIDVPDARIRVLPDPADVFVAAQPWLARVLHPLVWIELSALDASWRGRVPFLSPVEPESGLVGEHTASAHDDVAGENWISFHVDADSRLRFLGHRAYFEIEAQDGEPDPALDDLYTRAETEPAGARARWERLGELVWGDQDDPAIQREGWRTGIALVDQLGGDPGYGNWVSFPPPAAYVLDESDPVTPVLRLADGRPFAFVGATAGYPWRHEGADAILLFFEPETRTVALTFDWS